MGHMNPIAHTRQRPLPPVAASVAAELARRGLPRSALLPVLGLSKNTLYSRFLGKTSFTTDELELAADFLGMQVTAFWQDAA